MKNARKPMKIVSRFNTSGYCDAEVYMQLSELHILFFCNFLQNYSSLIAVVFILKTPKSAFFCSFPLLPSSTSVCFPQRSWQRSVNHEMKGSFCMQGSRSEEIIKLTIIFCFIQETMLPLGCFKLYFIPNFPQPRSRGEAPLPSLAVYIHLNCRVNQCILAQMFSIFL